MSRSSGELAPLPLHPIVLVVRLLRTYSNPRLSFSGESFVEQPRPGWPRLGGSWLRWLARVATVADPSRLLPSGLESQGAYPLDPARRRREHDCSSQAAFAGYAPCHFDLGGSPCLHTATIIATRGRGDMVIPRDQK